MNKLYSFLIYSILIVSFYNNLQAQATVTATPSQLVSGTTTTVVFSNGPFNFTNGTCILVYLQQGTNIIFTSASSVYYQASNVIVSQFDLASNLLTGSFNIVFFNFCNNSIVATIQNKMSLVKSAVSQVFQNIFDFEVFPNPIKNGDKLNILFHSKSQIPNSFNIYDNNGKVVYQNSSSNSINEVNLDGLTKGVYYIQTINAKGESLAKRIVIE